VLEPDKDGDYDVYVDVPKVEAAAGSFQIMIGENTIVGPKKPKIAHEGQLGNDFLALLKEKSFLDLRTCGMPPLHNVEANPSPQLYLRPCLIETLDRLGHIQKGRVLLTGSPGIGLASL